MKPTSSGTEVIGLPTFSLSSLMSSSALSSMASARASSAADRVAGVAVPQDSKAAWAAWTATSTSAADDEATSAMVVPVAGSITGSVRPSTVSTQPPSM